MDKAGLPSHYLVRFGQERFLVWFRHVNYLFGFRKTLWFRIDTLSIRDGYICDIG